jgi:hypothetical protein
MGSAGVYAPPGVAYSARAGVSREAAYISPSHGYMEPFLASPGGEGSYIDGSLGYIGGLTFYIESFPNYIGGLSVYIT